MSCGAESEANALMTSLMDGITWNVPNVNLDDPLLNLPTGLGLDSALYGVVKRLEVTDVTTGVVGGEGMFDKLAASMKAHLAEQYEKGRLTGSEYTRAYIELMTACMASAVSFLVQRDQAFWQAQQAQIAAITARVAMQTARVELAAMQLQAETARANYALTKLKLATESIQYCIANYNLVSMLPAQLALTTAQADAAKAQTDTVKYQLSDILPTQKTLLVEQTNAQRAQSSDTRTDGQPVAGTLGKQKDLYDQQITSYQRDAEVKAAKLFTDAWTVQKTVDDGIVPPDNFANASLNTILGHIKQNNNLG